MSVRLEGDLKDRLDALSAATGRPTSYYVREAVVEHLPDMEWVYMLRDEVESVRRGDIETMSSEDAAAELFGRTGRLRIRRGRLRAPLFRRVTHGAGCAVMVARPAHRR